MISYSKFSSADISLLFRILLLTPPLFLGIAKSTTTTILLLKQTFIPATDLVTYFPLLLYKHDSIEEHVSGLEQDKKLSTTDRTKAESDSAGNRKS